MVRPVIGVTLSSSRSKLVWYMHKLAIWRAGGKPKKVTPKTGPLLDADGFVLGGGDDIGFETTGMKVDPTVRYDPERDALELDVLKHAFETEKPVLGICRGSQMINVARGGTLYHDLSDFKEGLMRRDMPLPRKHITIKKQTLLHDLICKDTLRINALHHQSVKDLGEDLTISAKDNEGIVQAIECNKNGLILGVQWHPELIPWSGKHQALFRWLVQRADPAMQAA